MSLRQRMMLLALLDTVIVSFAVTFSYLLRFEFKIPDSMLVMLPWSILVNCVFVLIAFHFSKLYQRAWQYASISEMISIVKAILVAKLCVFIINRTVPGFYVPNSIVVINTALIIMGTGMVRLAWRLLRDRVFTASPQDRRNVLIIGAGHAGVLIVKELTQSKKSNLYPVAFIDDDHAKHGLQIMGLPILGGRDKIIHSVRNQDIQVVVIAMPSVPTGQIAEIIDVCKQTEADIKLLPSLHDLVSGKVSVSTMREVSLEDLLGREQVKLDLEEIAGYLTNKVVLVTGAGGSIGSELCRQACRFGPSKLLLLGHGENSIYDIEYELRKKYPEVNLYPLIADVQDYGRLQEIFQAYKPEVVFHAAAHKHVPLMEDNPAEAVKNNIIGTKNLAECADLNGSSHFIMISTDKAVNPTSVMGATKRVAEMYVQGLNKRSRTKFAAVRFGNVLGSRGSVIPLFKRQIATGGPVTVTHPDMKRYFMTVPEAVQLVVQAGSICHGGEVFVLDMGKPVKIYDLARDMIRLSGYKHDDIEIAFTGIRPGEKLFEEILTGEEGVSATRHQRIFVGKPGEINWDGLQTELRELETATMLTNIEQKARAVRVMLGTMVPGFSQVTDAQTYSMERTVFKEIRQGQEQAAASNIH